MLPAALTAPVFAAEAQAIDAAFLPASRRGNLVSAVNDYIHKRMVELMNQRKLVDNAFKRAGAEQKEGRPRFSVAPSWGLVSQKVSCLARSVAETGCGRLPVVGGRSVPGYLQPFCHSLRRNCNCCSWVAGLLNSSYKRQFWTIHSGQLIAGSWTRKRR
jgi:hypothetical protein